MNKRYRRQMMLRSRAHRRGEPIGCRCHRRVVMVIRPSYDPETEITICEPSWTPLKPRPRIRTLPDISTVTEAMLELAPVVDTTSAYFKKLREVYDAESQ